MKRNYFLLCGLLLAIALLSGILTSGISLIGRIGVNTFYKSYQFFRVWWQAGLVCLLLLLLVTGLLYLIDRKFTGIRRKSILGAFLVIFLAGLYMTYSNFRTDLAHRWLGERFHLGVYLYWIGFCVADVFFIITARPVKPVLADHLPHNEQERNSF
ncbi:cytochrome d ubiquinol oxidase subunit II [Niabella ginsenosidivorans]|uniref:Cytochrome d ubiquinol oxidase subunit II n=1 Tax=Niabella ginsenosidivorans TaxID=1176587 RepID=A0A1A9HXS3_9BACT|nr:cytochrome d ubiquinol oxidase subunit II [Niabella ginsenosidivorans]ANH80228.1 cytochrome d ubiquinol oxidase subunit II [Niabella ginsenosidivorans]